MNQHSFNLSSNYDLCRQHSACYLLSPPPRPPQFPEFKPSSDLHSPTNNLLIIFLIILAFIFLILLLIMSIYIFKHKLRERYCQTTKPTIIIDESSTSKSITPLTTLTNQSPSLNKSINFYEEIPYYHTCELTPSNIVCQTCLLKALHTRKQQQSQQCLCHNFFIPIK